MIKNLHYIVLVLTLTSCEAEPNITSSGVRFQVKNSSPNTMDSVHSEDSGLIAIGSISDSIVQIEYVYYKNNIYSRKNGSWKTYYKDGKLKSEAIIENGNTTQWKTYSRNGEVNEADIGC